MTTKHMREKDAQYLAAQIMERVPSVKVSVTEPSGRGTVWWIDVSAGGNDIVIEWSKEDGFGLSSPDGDDYNTAASETLADADAALARIIELLTQGEKVRPRREMYLQRLREHREISQEGLAELMQVSQASISKTERREDMLLSTLRGFVEALGGRLQLLVKFPSETIELDLPTGKQKHASR
jgi:DNA-binding transcriptional regulator YiaG